MATIVLSLAAKNARSQAFIDLVDSLAEPSVLKLYADPQPAYPDDVPNEAATLLAAFPCPKPFAPDAVGGAVVSNGFEQLIANGGSGVATWARLELSDGTSVGDFTVGLEGSGSNIEMANTNIYVGVILAVSNFQLIES
jgi:hypothetical protein